MRMSFGQTEQQYHRHKCRYYLTLCDTHCHSNRFYISHDLFGIMMRYYTARAEWKNNQITTTSEGEKETHFLTVLVVVLFFLFLRFSSSFDSSSVVRSLCMSALFACCCCWAVVSLRLRLFCVQHRSPYCSTVPYPAKEKKK